MTKYQLLSRGSAPPRRVVWALALFLGLFQARRRQRSNARFGGVTNAFQGRTIGVRRLSHTPRSGYEDDRYQGALERAKRQAFLSEARRLFRAVRPRRLDRLPMGERPAGAKARDRGDPRHWSMGGALHPAVAARHAAAPRRPMAQADQSASHDRPGGLWLRLRPFLPLRHRRPEARSSARGERDRAAILFDHRLCRLAGPW